MKDKTVRTDHAKLVKSAQECVVENEKVGSLNTGNCDVGSDGVRRTVDTRDIISRVNPEILSRQRSVAAGAA